MNIRIHLLKYFLKNFKNKMIQTPVHYIFSQFEGCLIYRRIVVFKKIHFPQSEISSQKDHSGVKMFVTLRTDKTLDFLAPELPDKKYRITEKSRDKPRDIKLVHLMSQNWAHKLALNYILPSFNFLAKIVHLLKKFSI